MDIALLGFLAVCGFLQTALSLSCYECNSLHNKTCSDKPPDSSKKECIKYGSPICRTVYMEVKANVDGMTPHHTRVIRSCGNMDLRDETKACYRISDYGVYQYVCSCTENYCNSSTKLVASYLIFLAFVWVVL